MWILGPVSIFSRKKKRTSRNNPFGWVCVSCAGGSGSDLMFGPWALPVFVWMHACVPRLRMIHGERYETRSSTHHHET